MKSLLKRKKSKKCAGFPVVKQLTDGTIVKEYASLIEAQELEGISYHRLVRVIKCREIVNGHIFSSNIIQAISNNNQPAAVRISRPVYKLNNEGIKVAEYVNVKTAAKEENIAEGWLRCIIYRKIMRQGFIYELGPLPKKNAPPTTPQVEALQAKTSFPWEGKNGMFSITGWAKMAMFA